MTSSSSRTVSVLVSLLVFAALVAVLPPSSSEKKVRGVISRTATSCALFLLLHVVSIESVLFQRISHELPRLTHSDRPFAAERDVIHHKKVKWNRCW